MPSRRLHQKTRHGCPQCKQRRVKCDTIRPECGNCRRRSSRCGFLEDVESGSFNLATITQNEVQVSASSEDFLIPSNNGPIASPMSIFPVFPEDLLFWQSSPLNIEPSPPKPIPWLTPQESNLFHHYSSSTALSMSDVAHIRQVWQVVVPREALPYDFLVHGLVSFAAIHVANTCPSGGQFYKRLACSHRQRALQSALAPLNNITSANCHALFAFAGVTAFSTFTLHGLERSGPSPSPVDLMLDFFPVVRGTKTVLRSALEWISHGTLNPLIERQWDEWKSDAASVPSAVTPEVKMHLCELEGLNRRTARDKEKYECFAVAIQRLMDVYDTYKYIAGDRSLVFVWTVVVNNEFVAALQAREPMALVILAHYGILIHSVDEQWWAKGRGAELIEAIHLELPAEWKDAVTWPLKVVRSADPVFRDVKAPRTI